MYPSYCSAYSYVYIHFHLCMVFITAFQYVCYGNATKISTKKYYKYLSFMYIYIYTVYIYIYIMTIYIHTYIYIYQYIYIYMAAHANLLTTYARIFDYVYQQAGKATKMAIAKPI